MPDATPIAVGIDIGGTRVKSVLMNHAGVALRQDERDSVEGAQALIDLVESIRASLGAGAGLPIGISCPGLAQRDHRAIASMPGRMAGLEGLVFGEALGQEVVVLNDAHAATIGEAVLGAAAGRQNVVMLTLGTGVGGGVMINGRLYTGANGRAGHFGHMTIDAAGPPDICNTPGSIEDAIGNHNISKRSNGSFTSTRDLLDAVNKKDPVAIDVWHASINRLAAAVASLINAFDPEAIVIGGGIAAAGPDLFEPLGQAMDRMEWRPLGEAVPILPATLGIQAGALGAALFANRPELRP
ncbi:MAG: ROK family protein [Phycisphaeraceae bacterium]